MRYVFFFLLSLHCYAFGVIPNNINQDKEFEQMTWAINQYEQCWNAGETEDRIYLKAEAIVNNENSVFLVVGNYLLPIDSIQSDFNGYYMCSENWLWWTCCRCQYKNGKAFLTCQNCHRQKC